VEQHSSTDVSTIPVAPGLIGSGASGGLMVPAAISSPSRQEIRHVVLRELRTFHASLAGSSRTCVAMSRLIGTITHYDRFLHSGVREGETGQPLTTAPEWTQIKDDDGDVFYFSESL